MGFTVYDYRTDNRNVLITPEIRARLYHMAPGQVDRRHSHDLGHEVFLILEGRAAFEINGETKELGPGQMCIALADEIHQVRNLLPDKPTIMYLSVTPHIQPTHSGRNADNSKQPPHFNPNSNYSGQPDADLPLAELLDHHLQAAQAVVDAAQASLMAQRKMATRLLQANSAGDADGARAARNAMWDAIYTLHKQVYTQGSAWNELAPHAATNEG